MDKLAKWADVKSKGEAIAAVGGVEIIAETKDEIEAYVMSIDVADEFPVTDGGPYHVILSKRSWENQKNVGGWIQGYLCDCLWGTYNSGEPGPRYRGRFCSHAYATLLVSNARARRDFMNDRTAAVEEEHVDFGFRWTPCKLSDGSYVASYRGRRATVVKAPSPTHSLDACVDEMRAAILGAYLDYDEDTWERIMSDDSDEAYDKVELDAEMVKESVYHDWVEQDGYEGWAIPFTLYQCDESEPWFGMDYDDALENGFDFAAYDYRFDGLLDDAEKYNADERVAIIFIWGDIEHGCYPDFRGHHMPKYSDIVEFETGFYYVGPHGMVMINPNRKGMQMAAGKQALLDDQFAYLADDFYDEYKDTPFDSIYELEDKLYEWVDANGYDALPDEKLDILFDLIIDAYDYASHMVFKPKHNASVTQRGASRKSADICEYFDMPICGGKYAVQTVYDPKMGDVIMVVDESGYIIIGFADDELSYNPTAMAGLVIDAIGADRFDDANDALRRELHDAIDESKSFLNDMHE